MRRAYLVLKFITHGRHVQCLASKLGWLPGARYTNLRDVRSFEQLGFLDVDWQNYNFNRHLETTRITRPLVTVAQDIRNRNSLNRILDQADRLSQWAEHVIVVPKALSLAEDLEEVIPPQFILGYSVPTTYGGTRIPPNFFKRPVHLLGGRPDTQRKLAEEMSVISLDCNRFTLDAAYGDHFDGTTFRPHPNGGYDACIRSSLRHINRLWESYVPALSPKSDYFSLGKCNGTRRLASTVTPPNVRPAF